MRRLTWLMAMLACAACARSDGKSSVLSERFETCIRLPDAASYHRVSKGVDFDIGQLNMASSPIEVHIGQSVGFATKAAAPLLAKTSGHFVFIDRQESQGVRKLLFAQKRFAKRGPLFVMFQGKTDAMQASESQLMSDEFITYCKIPLGNGEDHERWREGDVNPE